MDNLTTSILKPEEWEVWKELRIDMLQNNPELFATPIDSELTKPDRVYQQQAFQNIIFVTKIDQNPIACLCCFRSPYEKIKHRANIWCLYTKPEYRQQGIGTALFTYFFKAMERELLCVNTTCLSTSEYALKVFKKFGFITLATLPKTFKNQAEYFDSYLLQLMLDN